MADYVVNYESPQFVLVRLEGERFMLARKPSGADDNSDIYDFVAAGTFKQMAPLAQMGNEYHRWNMNGGVNPDE